MRFAFTVLLLAGCAEPGFMAVRPDFRASDVPITVCAAAYAGGSIGAVKQVSSAIGTTDQRLGFKLFVLAESNCDVQFTIGVPVEAGWRDPGGDAVFGTQATGLRCRATTSNVPSIEILGYVIQHELGHCAGLDHDDWDGSIMRRTQRIRGDTEFPPWISDSDRALLRSTYMR